MRTTGNALVFFKRIFRIGSFFLLTGCMTLTGGTNQYVEIQSDRPGVQAVILLNGEVVRTSDPGDEWIAVPKTPGVVIRFDLKGHPSKSFVPTVRPDQVQGVKVLLFNLPNIFVGYLIDEANGATNVIAPETVELKWSEDQSK